jgi:hypothetical protein
MLTPGMVGRKTAGNNHVHRSRGRCFVAMLRLPPRLGDVCRYLNRDCDMPVVIISGAALAFASNPRSDTPVDDSATLARLHGVYADDICSQYLTDPELKNLTISGGRVRIIYC